MPVDDAVMGDACDWMVQLEQEEECAPELNYYETIIAEEEEQSNEVEIVSLDPSLMVTDDIMEMDPNSPTSFPLHPLKNSNTLRLHKINDGSVRPKNMTITRVGEAMSSGGLTDADLSDVMVEVFSATHRTGKYIPGEEPLLGTSICRFSGVDLSLDYHSPETAHSAHAAVVRRAAEETFEKHLLPLDVPCTYHSQGPTKKQNPKLCGWARSKTRQEQAGHVFGHTLTHHKQHHAVGNIPRGVWHCYYDGCAVLTTSPSINTKHPKVHLSTTSIFSSEQTYLRHLYQGHRLSPVGAESVTWCGICEHFLEWDQFGPGKDEHFNGHWEEVWRLVAEHGYMGQYDNGRRTIPSFCPFCLHNENLSPSKRISKTMNLLGRGDYQKHIAMHFDGADLDLIHPCPCFPKTCSYQENMTPTELTSHLSHVHSIQRAKVSRGKRRKNAKVFSERSVNIQVAIGEEKPSKRARR